MQKIIFVLALTVIINSAVYSTIGAPVSLAVTVYNNQFAIIKDTRSIKFTKGRSDLYFTDVSSNIQTQTVSFKALRNTQSIKVYEQNYEANLVNSEAILKKYINKNVQIYAKYGQNSNRINGTLLGYNSGYILQTNKGIEVIKNVDGISFKSLPDGFFTLPTLNWKVQSSADITTPCQVAYRTTGFSWKSDYLVVVNQDQTAADIGGWVTIDNYSGKKYENAKLKLIAGDVNTVNTQNSSPVMYMTMARASPAPSFSEKSFSDFHMYTLSEPVTLNDNSKKQIEFIPKVYNAKIRKYNKITVNTGGYDNLNIKAQNKIQFSNTKSNKLGLPLPKGTVRVFKTDQEDGSLQFIGEDSINHTPVDQNIILTTGNSFDITANLYGKNRRTFGNKGGYTADANLTVWNHKNIPAEIVIQIPNYQGDNLKITFTNPTQFTLQTISSSLLRVTKNFKQNQKYSFLWQEDYRP